MPTARIYQAKPAYTIYESQVDEPVHTTKNQEKSTVVKRKQLWPSLLTLIIVICASLTVALLSLLLLGVHWGPPPSPEPAASHLVLMREVSFTLGCLALTASLLSAYISLIQLLVALKAVNAARYDADAGEHMLRQGVYLRFIATVLMLISAPLVLLGALAYTHSALVAMSAVGTSVFTVAAACACAGGLLATVHLCGVWLSRVTSLTKAQDHLTSAFCPGSYMSSSRYTKHQLTPESKDTLDNLSTLV